LRQSNVWGGWEEGGRERGREGKREGGNEAKRGVRYAGAVMAVAG